MKLKSLTFQIKAIEQLLPMVLLSLLCKVVLPFESQDAPYRPAVIKAILYDVVTA